MRTPQTGPRGGCTLPFGIIIALLSLLTLAACESFSFSRSEFQVRERRLQRPEREWRPEMERKLDCMEQGRKDC